MLQIMVLLLLLMSPALVAAERVTISAEQWARPRSGESIVQSGWFKKAVKALETGPHVELVIRFAGGDEGLLWAEELRGWLVSLGVPSKRIVLRPGSSRGNTIVLETKTGGNGFE